MGIRKASVINLNDVPQRKGRHPLLSGTSDHLMIYDFVKNHPNSTAPTIGTQLNVNHQRISELVAEGLLVKTGREGRFTTYSVNEKMETGYGRPHLRVEIQLHVDANGTPVVSAHILDKDGKRLPTRPTTGPLTFAGSKKTTFIAPDTTKIDIIQDDGIIDADFVEIS